MENISGKIIISTRPISKSDSIASYLSGKAATVIHFPMIEISAACIPEEKEEILKSLSAFTWIIFTSHNGVRYFFEKLQKMNLFDQPNPNIRFAVIGNKTADELTKFGVKANYISEGATSELFLEELRSGVLNPDDKVLLSLGNLAGNTLEKGLSPILEVKRLDVYDTKPVIEYSKEILNRIIANNYDLIIFTSPSGVERLVEIIGKEQLPHLKAVCIGKTTEKALLKYGICPLLISSKSEGNRFAEEIKDYLLTY